MPPLPKSFLRRPLNLRPPTTSWSIVHARNITDGRLRLSNIWIPTLGEDFKESPHHDSNTHDGNTHLLRAGYIRQSQAGIFHYLPLGQRVLEKLTRLLDSHMTLGLGASKVGLSGLSAVELWRQSGRVQGSLRAPGHEFFAVRDRPETEEDEKLVLAPTCEEEITTMVKTRVAYGESLPLRLYQIERKYRNEMRPRKGLLRSKEFVMKDLYSFDSNQEDAMKTYNLVKAVYDEFFEALGVPFLVAEADSGNMGGNLSHEYHYVSDLGEDTVWTCSGCKLTANDEVVPKKEADSTSHNCPQCDSKLLPHRTIEVGHTFFLGDRYTSKFDCRVPSAKSSSKVADKGDPNYAQMGCYGIGVSRLVGAIAAMCQHQVEGKPDQIQIRWPKLIAPFSTVILANKKKHPEDLAAVYDALTHRASSDNFDAVIDDRPGKSLVFKMKDAEMHGAPVICVLGEAWEKDQHVEVRISSGDETKVEYTPLERVQDTVYKALNDDTHI